MTLIKNTGEKGNTSPDFYFTVTFSNTGIKLLFYYSLLQVRELFNIMML